MPETKPSELEVEESRLLIIMQIASEKLEQEKKLFKAEAIQAAIRLLPNQYFRTVFKLI